MRPRYNRTERTRHTRYYVFNHHPFLCSRTARKCRMNKSLQVAELETQLHTAHADNSALAGHIAKVVALYQRERTTKDQFRGLMLALSAQLPPVVGSSSSGGGSSSLSIARVVNALESDPPTMSYDEALHGIAVQAGALHAALERAGRMQEALGAALTQQQALQAQLQATLQAQQAEQQGQGQGQAAEQTVLRPSVKDPCQQPAGSAPAPQAHAQAQPRGAQASLSRQPAMPYVGPTSFTATVTRAAEQVPPGSRPGGPSLAAQAAAHRGATTECITEDTFHTTAQIQPRLHTDDAAQEGSLRIEHVVSSAHEPSTALGQQQPGSTQSSRSKRKRSLDSAPMPPVESSMQYSQRPIREHGDLKASAGMLHGRDPQACVHEPANGLHLLLAAVAAPEMQAPVAEAAHEWYAE